MSDVWDASAVLVVLNREPGWEALIGRWTSGSISAVNLSEVSAKLAERGLTESEVREVIAAIELEIHPFDANDAVRAGMLRPLTKELGLSLGDRACLALGLRLGQPVLTTDRVWKDLDLPIEITLGR